MEIASYEDLIKYLKSLPTKQELNCNYYLDSLHLER